MQKWALAAGFALMVVWGVNFAVTKIVLAELGVGPFLFIRFLAMPLFGFALLAAISRRHFAKSWPRREDLPRFIACGLIGHTAHVGIVMWGLNLSTPFSSSLVLCSSPLFTWSRMAWRTSSAPWPALVTSTPLLQSSQRFPCLS